LRALQTVAPLAAARGLRVEPLENLREHQLSPEPIAHWREVLEASWRDLNAAPGGAETLAFTRRRGLQALEQLRVAHPVGTIAIGGHGTLFACILQAFRPSVDCDFHLAMPMPAVYELAHGAAGWRILSGPGIDG
jgi:2,3-bisphosphoglycerate-dependent phosphoglycerate mutase